MKLTEQEESRLFGINCVVGKNYSSDYEACVKKAEELKQPDNWSEVENQIRDDLKSKYPKTEK
jgi:hypothetical protein